MGVKVSASKLESVADKTLAVLKIKNLSVMVFLISEEEMIALKAKFLKGKSGEADVLAFPEPKGFPHPEAPRQRVLGEIYLNRDLIRGDLKRASYFLIHGLLHLMGYRHGRKADRIRMERKENKLLKFLMSNF